MEWIDEENTCEPVVISVDVRWIMALALVFCSALSMAASVSTNESPQQQDTRRFTYSWQFHSDSELAPRGGTTRGAGVTRAPQPNVAWLSLTEDGLSAFERDRLAILAMAGEYQASFDFIETIGFEGGYVPKAPYQSWGTEYIFVVEDRGSFISLQHILVMIVQMPDGSMSEPMTMKHWRQDWTFEDTEMNVFVGNNTWEPKSIPATSATGTWTQAVYQVDDSPRYESFGKWVHKAGTSFWQSGQTRRPVPRRETSVRKTMTICLVLTAIPLRQVVGPKKRTTSRCSCWRMQRKVAIQRWCWRARRVSIGMRRSLISTFPH